MNFLHSKSYYRQKETQLNYEVKNFLFFKLNAVISPVATQEHNEDQHVHSHPQIFPFSLVLCLPPKAPLSPSAFSCPEEVGGGERVVTGHH